MYKRIRDGLIDPKRIVDYIADKFYPFILLALWIIILMLPSFIRTVNFSFTFEDKRVITQAFKRQNIGYKIVNGKLEKKSGNLNSSYEVVYNGYNIIIGEDKKVNSSSICFLEDHAEFRISFINIDLGKYSEIEGLNNFDFDSLTTGENANWDPIFKYANKAYDANVGYAIIYSIFTSFLENLSLLAMFILIASLFGFFRMRKAVKFWIVVKIAIYSLIPYVVGTLLDNIFDSTIIYFIGMIVSFMYAFIAELEIMKRIYNSNKES